MRILVLTFYFPPDLSAGSFRAAAIVNALSQLLPDSSQIDVISTLPNRYHSYGAAASVVERQGKVSIFRVELPRHKSGLLDQSRAFVAFFLGSVREVARRDDYDIVFATSSRLMTGVLGSLISRRRNARLYLDIRDIFVETILDVIPRRSVWLVKPIFSFLERWTLKHASRVNLVSPGFRDYFSARYPRLRYSFFTNGIDNEFLVSPPSTTTVASSDSLDRPIVVTYAGNLGEGQGLHAIIPQLAERMGNRVRFKIIGDGGRKEVLIAALARRHVNNVQLCPPVKREELLAAYRAADVLFLHLNDYDAFRKVLPSKLFEYAALGKPIWAGVAGFPAEFVKSEIENATVFKPCDVESAVDAFNRLSLHDTPRVAFIQKYSRARVTQRMAEDILSLVSPGR